VQFPAIGQRVEFSGTRAKRVHGCLNGPRRSRLGCPWHYRPAPPPIEGPLKERHQESANLSALRSHAILNPTRDLADRSAREEGQAALVSPHEVKVGGRRYEGEHFAIKLAALSFFEDVDKLSCCSL
jgi:hypothetical protein